jgi:hypothetical protein
MTIKREAAFHEAGHVLAAYRSKFHALVGPVNLQQYGAGEACISLSKKKLHAAGKHLAAVHQSDKDVATDIAVVLCAGLVSEQLAEEKVGLKADPNAAIPDYDLMKQQLKNAGLSARFDRHESSARQLLEAEWTLVCCIADFLYENVDTDPTDIIDLIERYTQR